MVEIAELESRIDDTQSVFHKPFNDGFIAFGEQKIYIVRDKQEFEFEEISRDQVHSIRASEVEEYTPENNYEKQENAEKQTTYENDYTKIQILLKTKAVCVVVKECPKQVTRELLEIDF